MYRLSQLALVLSVAVVSIGWQTLQQEEQKQKEVHFNGEPKDSRHPGQGTGSLEERKRGVPSTEEQHGGHTRD